MLRRLHIRDFVIVDELELEFAAGYGAVTGETGAGKSILVDALSLVLGERAEASAVRTGAERADITAEFEATGAAAEWLVENDLRGDGCLLRRVVEAGGRSRAYVNGVPVTLGKLKDLGDLLADIHGQHAHLGLLRPDAQRALVDEFGGTSELARAVAARYRDWMRCQDARRAAERNATEFERERERLDWQLAELARLRFDPGEWLELNHEHRRLAHAATLLEGAGAVLEAIDEGEASVSGRLGQAGTRLAAMLEFDTSVDEIARLLASARNEAIEAARALRRYRDRLEVDPQRLGQIEDRIAATIELARKHRVAPEQLPAIASRLRARSEELGTTADSALLAQRERVARDGYLEAANRLSAQRAQTASDLSEKVTAALRDLAMPDGRFDVVLSPLPEGGSCGLDHVEFRVCANAGQRPGPLSRVASGGELSRLGLAVQVITSNAGQAETLIFDEVDSGIGGATAEVVGRMLRKIGRDRQVLCVTHHAQVAAQADWQWSVSKVSAGGSTSSRVRRLDGKGRVEEIARMLGGIEVTETTRRHAREMLGL
jgi:DNA repair protein RecN (Recombination protein N)